MNETCVLCGKGPIWATDDGHGFFGAVVPEGRIHHHYDTQVVGRRDNGTPIKVTCYEAWTVYGQRPPRSL